MASFCLYSLIGGIFFGIYASLNYKILVSVVGILVMINYVLDLKIFRRKWTNHLPGEAKNIIFSILTVFVLFVFSFWVAILVLMVL
jgi:hypothetical protein